MRTTYKNSKYIETEMAKGENPYPHKIFVLMFIPEYIEKYDYLAIGECIEGAKVTLAGRIMNKRSASSKLFFYDLQGDDFKVQVMANASNSELDTTAFSKLHETAKRGDLVGVTGFPGKKKKGELTIFPRSFIILSHCHYMIPLVIVNSKKPENWVPGKPRNPEAHILKDPETRYRQRYVYLMLNVEVCQIFRTRAKIISYIRRFLDNKNFLEVETPAMNNIAGGAATRPFVTHHNELDYYDLMKLTEEFLTGLVKELTGGYIIQYHSNGYDMEPIEVDFTPFRRIEMIGELEKVANFNIPKDFASEEANKYLIDACAGHDAGKPLQVYFRKKG